MAERILQVTPLEVAVAVLCKCWWVRHPNPKVVKYLYPFIEPTYRKDYSLSLDEISRDDQRSLSIVNSVKQLREQTWTDYEERMERIWAGYFKEKPSSQFISTFNLRFDIDAGLIRSYRQTAAELNITQTEARDQIKEGLSVLGHPSHFFLKHTRPILDSLSST